MQGQVALELMRRAVKIAENEWPECAESHMEVPLHYFVSEELAAKEKALFETSPLALVASSEIANPNDTRSNDPCIDATQTEPSPYWRSDRVRRIHAKAREVSRMQPLRPRAAAIEIPHAVKREQTFLRRYR